MNFDYHIPTKVLFGPGRLGQLSEYGLPGKNALIVMSAGKSARKNGYLDKLTAQLDKSGVKYTDFEKIQPNPTKKSVMEGAALAKQQGCDFIIALGGGSSIDAAKAISIMAVHEGDYWDYIPSGTGKGKPIPNDPLPVVVISTTSGTGSESDPWAVITNEETNEKIGYGYAKTFPVLSIVDPELTLTVPPHLTAYQGFDVLFHSTEGYINNTSYPISDIYCLKAIELVGKNLANAVADGSNMEARENMAVANILAGFVQSTSGCVSQHAMEHALSAFHPELPHGAGLVLISKEYFSFHAKSGTCDQRMIDMAVALGKKDAKDPMDFIDALMDLQRACGVADLKMSDFGIKQDEMLTLAKNARDTMGGMFTCDPAPINEADCVGIYERSYR